MHLIPFYDKMHSTFYIKKFRKRKVNGLYLHEDILF